MKFSQTERGSTTFLLLQGGIKNLTESFIPFLPHPPPRELKNDNSLGFLQIVQYCKILHPYTTVIHKAIYFGHTIKYIMECVKAFTSVHV